MGLYLKALSFLSFIPTYKGESQNFRIARNLYRFYNTPLHHADEEAEAHSPLLQSLAPSRYSTQ